MSFVDDRTRAAWSVLFDSTPDLVNLMKQVSYQFVLCRSAQFFTYGNNVMALFCVQVLLARASAVQFTDVQMQDLIPPDSTATPLSAGDTVELKLVGHIIVNIASTDKPPALGQVSSFPIHGFYEYKRSGIRVILIYFVYMYCTTCSVGTKYF